MEFLRSCTADFPDINSIRSGFAGSENTPRFCTHCHCLYEKATTGATIALRMRCVLDQNRRPNPKTKESLMPIGASLHIGLNAVDPKQYSGWGGQLTACEFDANDMQALAKARGFTKVTKRLTKKATRNRVLADIKAAARKLKRNDIFFLTYSDMGARCRTRGTISSRMASMKPGVYMMAN
jgi:hypothetical protein